ncbi:hypothetical protein ACXR2U_01310, partial [Jatrophihabitans sp. YIM 134969]
MSPRPDDDPTEILQTWREQRRSERLAETGVIPVVEADSPPPRRRAAGLLVAFCAGALVAGAGAAVAV